MHGRKVENELVESSQWIHSKKAGFINEFLKQRFAIFVQILVLHDHFGQVEEYLVLMVNGDSSVEMEVSKSKVVDFRASKIEVYLLENKTIPKHFRRRIKIA